MQAQWNAFNLGPDIILTFEELCIMKRQENLYFKCNTINSLKTSRSCKLLFGTLSKGVKKRIT